MASASVLPLPLQAERAINTLNGCEMDGRNIMVREDREDRDVKTYQEGGGFAPPPQGKEWEHRDLVPHQKAEVFSLP